MMLNIKKHRRFCPPVWWFALAFVLGFIWAPVVDSVRSTSSDECNWAWQDSGSVARLELTTGLVVSSGAPFCVTTTAMTLSHDPLPYYMGISGVVDPQGITCVTDLTYPITLQQDSVLTDSRFSLPAVFVPDTVKGGIP